MKIDTEYLELLGVKPFDRKIFVKRAEAGIFSSLTSLLEELTNDDMAATLKVLKLDRDRFYTLVLFCYDYAKDVCLNKTDIVDGGYEMMWKLIDRGSRLLNNCPWEPIDTDASCSFKIQGKTYKVKDTDSIAILLYWIHRGMINMNPNHPIWELNWLINDYEQHERHGGMSMSTVIWCFASLLLEFFRRNPHFNGRAPRGSGISANKRLLISQLTYHLGLSNNDSFIFSDETLKGFLKQYKNMPLPTRGEIYGRKVKGE